MQKSDSGKSAIVTGGTKGLGREIALTLAEQGYRVFAWYHADESAAQEIAAEAEARKLIVECHRIDVSKPEGVDAFFSSVPGLETLDVLVNNASPGFALKPFLKTEPEEFGRFFDVNVAAAVRLAQKCIPLFKKRSHGRIINVLSSNVLGSPVLGMSAYSVSKYALLGLTQVLAKDFAKYNISVNAVAPSVMECGVTLDWPDHLRNLVLEKSARKSFIHPREVAEVVAFLASPRAQAMTGAVIPILNGMDS
jgi:3-oxoacyl-[acyl-carrier protein] reductase